MASKRSVTHLLTLADLSPSQITRILTHARYLKQSSLPWLAPHSRTSRDAGSPFITPGQVLEQDKTRRLPSQSLFLKTIALLFSKRSTRTRLAAETAASLLGGKALFLGREDIQMGVNESIRDSARVIGGMTQGIFARVGEHDEIEELAKYSPVPVLNALSSLWHPTQVLADLLTLHEHAHMFDPTETTAQIPDDYQLMYHRMRSFVPLPKLRPLTIAYVGDSANVLHDMLVTYPRLGHRLRVATPDHDRYRAPKAVWERVELLGCHTGITWVVDPTEAVKGADLVVTDTWISMGQEAEKAERLRAFQGYQVTERLCREGGANPDWKFMHCLPRKQHEVDDEVFYGSRSLVFPEADNRKWTIMALFDLLFGKHDLVPILPNTDPSRKPSRTAPPVKRAPEAAEPAEVQN